MGLSVPGFHSGVGCNLKFISVPGILLIFEKMSYIPAGLKLYVAKDDRELPSFLSLPSARVTGVQYHA